MLNTKNDVELTPGPMDGASSLSFSPVADYLAASSWDGQVTLIRIDREIDMIIIITHFNFNSYF